MRIIVFRVDASREIGTGHVMRCLTLADALKEAGCRSLFLCRQAEGNLSEYIAARGHEVDWVDGINWEQDAETAIAIHRRLPVQPEWLVVDHYELDFQWERKLRPYAQRILVIDDLANRRHDCDILVDQNLTATPELYRDLVPKDCRLLLGPGYLLLNPAFNRLRESLPRRDGCIRRLLVFFGGTDPTAETEKVLQALSVDGFETDIDIVVGKSNPRLEYIKEKASRLARSQLHVQTDKMAELIASADFALGAGGVAMWERCYLGLPSAVTIVANNQRESVEQAARAGAIWLTGEHERTTPKHYRDILLRAMNSPAELRELSERALSLVSVRESDLTDTVATDMLR